MTRTKVSSAFIFVLCALSFFACRNKEYAKLKSSTRRISSEMRYFERSTAGLAAAIGLGKASENVDTTEMQFAPLKQKNFIEEYDFLYDAINGEASTNYLQSFEYDTLKEQYKRQGFGEKTLREDVEVYTWYPYWMGDVWKSYDFNLISTISFFSYKIDPKTGGYLNPAQIVQWRETDLLDSAAKYNTKTLLNLALEGDQNQQDFLKNEALWNVTLDSIAVLIKERDADGIEIEFPAIAQQSASKFQDFVNFMRNNLDYRFIAKRMYLAVVIPAAVESFPIDLIKLDESVDLFIVKGLDYHEIDGNTPAIAPLRSDISNGFSLENTLIQYLEKGLSAEKSILALPLYGAQWAGSWNGEEGYYSSNFKNKVTLSEVNRVYQSKDSSYAIIPMLDEVMMTNYFFLEFPDGTSVDCWYDDSYTLSKKMDLALSRKFKGIGLWALGYDLGMDDIWNVVGNKFASDEVYVKDPIAEMDGYPIKIASFFQTYERLFVITFLILTVILFFTLALAFSDWRFRDSILARQLYRVIFLSIFICIFIIIFSYFGILEGSNWRLILLFILGAMSYYYIEKYGGLIKINKP
jgi:spore germination protein YaaH